MCYVGGLISHNGFCKAVKDIWYVVSEKFKVVVIRK